MTGVPWPAMCARFLPTRAAGCDNLHVRTIIEPFRIKSVEPLHHTTPAERQRYLEAAGYNLFLIEIGRAHV